MEITIPIYRAERKDGKGLVEGFLYQDIIKYTKSDGVTPDQYKRALDENSWYIMDSLSNTDMIKIETLAIHFPDMIDSRGTRIFASLNKNGKGGDITKTKDGYNIYKRVHLVFSDGSRGSKDLEIIESLLKKYNSVLDLEVIGVQQ